MHYIDDCIEDVQIRRDAGITSDYFNIKLKKLALLNKIYLGGFTNTLKSRYTF